MRAIALAFVAALVGLSPAVAQQITLSGPPSAPLNSTFDVTWTGPDGQGDYITIGTGQGKPVPYSSYAYTAASKNGVVTLTAPLTAGDYSIVYVGGDRSPLAYVPLTVEPVSATIEAPASVPANESFTVVWTGPNNKGDRVAIGNANGGKIPYSSYGYTSQFPGELPLKAPEKPGAYSVIYTTGDVVVASVPLTVGGLDATLSVDGPVMAGAPFTVAWTGPDNENDRVRIHDASGTWIPYASYAYTSLNPDAAELVAPETPGAYTVAYVTGDTVVTTVPITVGDVSAQLAAAAEVPAGLAFPVRWAGPGNPRDLIGMYGDDPDFPVARGYIANAEGDIVMLIAPELNGDFELRYHTPGGRQLAARAIRVVAPPEKPGLLEVLPATQVIGFSALEVILDASGSMLQRQDGKRRIEIAKETLSRLIAENVPAGTPFALRVFGHREADSCRTDLEVPLTPLDPGSLLGLINGVQAMNLAKTPIARSLELVASDLSAATGERVVILVTDGEETCDGDPAAAIASLRAGGADLRVNIVGYAIDDAGLADTFARWAELGGGAYFSAGNQSELSSALTAAAQPKFAVIDAAGTVVARGLAGGERITLPAGTYEVRFADGAYANAGIRPETVTQVQP